MNFRLFVKLSAIFLIIILGARLTRGYFMIIPVFAVYFWAMTGRNGYALWGYALFPVILLLNSTIIGQSGMGFLFVRIGVLTTPLMFFLGSRRKYSQRIIPWGCLYVYLLWACVSSAFGWFPLISYVKLLYFGTFLIGINMGVKNLYGDVEGMKVLRAGMLVLAAFIVIGSLATYPFPGVGYSMEVSNARLWGAVGDDAEIAEELLETRDQVLFSGVFLHSQMLGPAAVIMSSWVFCDMLFVAHKISVIHMCILGAMPVVLFMTRSRTGLLALLVFAGLMMMYGFRSFLINARIKRKMQAVLNFCLVLLVLGGVVAEIRSNAMSKWLLKGQGNDASEISAESLTSTRMGLIERNLYDFYQNPISGMGFQTARIHRDLYAAGRISIFSAPIEKGVLPTVVLGECGIIGAIIFLVFICKFYVSLNRVHAYNTVVLFSVFLTSNMGEASFFSPGGIGALYWVVSVIGGTCIDNLSFIQNEMHGYWMNYER